MGTLFRKTYTRAIPAKAELVMVEGKLCARWRGRGSKSIVEEVATGCRDKSAAEQFLSRLEREADRVKAGVVTTEEVHRAKHQADAIGRHIRDYVSTLTGSADHRDKTHRYLEQLAGILGWSTLADLRRDALELWLVGQIGAGRSARSCNGYRIAASGLCTWLVKSKRLAANPFSGMDKFDEKADARRPRRALSHDEFRRLVEAARQAPARPPGKSGANSLRPAQRLSGPARAELYLVLVATGLRIGELADVLVRDVHLEGPVPHIDLPAAVDKGRDKALIPLRRDLVAMLRPLVETRTPAAKVFDVPADLIKRFNADCKRAGIPKRDHRGKTVDLHSLRMTFNTWLAAAGVAPRIAEELMRHEDIDMTMNVYTDPALFDLSAAVESLPMMPFLMQ